MKNTLKKIYIHCIEPIMKKHYPKLEKTMYPKLETDKYEIGYFDGKNLEAKEKK